MLILIGLLVILPMLGPQLGVDPSIVSGGSAANLSALVVAREHARLALLNLDLVLEDRAALEWLQGAPLLRKVV